MSDTITLILNGDVSLDDFAVAVEEFRGTVREMAAVERDSEDVIEWRIVRLDTGSAIVGVQGIGRPARVDLAVREFEEFSTALEMGDVLHLPPRLQERATGLVSVINGQVDSLRFETDTLGAVITHASKTAVMEARPLTSFTPPKLQAWGAVRGKVQTLRSREDYCFTLYDSLYDKGVTCYLSPEHEEIMRDAWGRIVVVEGWVTRDGETGRPIEIRQIKRIVFLSDEVTTTELVQNAG